MDAISIDQENVSERNHQVRMMNMIYERAKRVVVWLGPETAVTRKAISFLKQLEDGTVPIQECDRLPRKTDWEAVKDFCEMEYWSRL